MLHNPGILIVGHGTRDAEGVAEFVATARNAADMLADHVVEHCFLELATPTIADAVDRLAQAGVEKIVVVPLLLFAAGHAKQDIPRMISEASAGRNMATYQAKPLGCHEKVVAASIERFHEAAGSLTSDEFEQTLLILVGRGTSDSDAVAEMQEFADRRAKATKLGGVQIAFMAAAEPPAAKVLEAAATSCFDRVVVQPHLLFQGQVLHELRDLVDFAGRTGRENQTEWLLAEHLGPSRWIVEAVVDRSREVLTREGF